MIDVTVVGGFLGAGKTTWLSRILEDHAPGKAGGSVAVIVNDYASVGVDDWLLDAALGKGRSAGISLVAGGCVCCDKREELVSLLISLVGSAHRAGLPEGEVLRHIFIETSGVADPRSIVEAITEHPVLQANLTLKELVVVVDGVNGTSQLRHQELARDQISCADRVVYSKMDLVADQPFALLAGLVTRLNPNAGQTCAVDGRESSLTQKQTSLIEGLAPADTARSWEPEQLSPKAWTVELSRNVCWAEYALWLDALTRTHPEHILRSKGTIQTPNGRIVLQTVGSVIAQPRPAPAAEHPTDSEPTVMVFIIQGLDLDLLARSLRSFVPSAFPSSAQQIGAN